MIEDLAQERGTDSPTLARRIGRSVTSMIGIGQGKTEISLDA